MISVAFKQIDTNNDGLLDEEELEKMRKFVKESLNLDLHYDYNNLFKSYQIYKV